MYLFFVSYLVAVCVLDLCIAQTALLPGDARKIAIRKECAANSTKLTPEEFNLVIVKRQPPTTKEGECFVDCIYTALNFFNEKNEVNEDNMEKELKLVNPNGGEEYEKKLKIIRICRDNIAKLPSNLEDCKAAAALTTCLADEKKKANVTTRIW